MKKNYNVKELQEKNKEIIKQNQEEMSEILQDNIPEKNLKQGGVSVGGVEETKREAEEATVTQMVEGERDKETTVADDVSCLSDDDEGATEEKKSNNFFRKYSI